MSANDQISKYYSALINARNWVSDIDKGAIVHRFAEPNSSGLDVTENLRAHQQVLIEILEELVQDKERRKSPRR